MLVFWLNCATHSREVSWNKNMYDFWENYDTIDKSDMVKDNMK